MKFDPAKLPVHVAFIMDGNGRWATARGLDRREGHRKGVKTMFSVVGSAFKIGVKYVTVYAFSTENWNRPKKEVDELMRLFHRYFTTRLSKLTSKGIKVNVIGSTKGLSDTILSDIRDLSRVETGKVNGVLNIALNYGGRDEIIEAVNAAIKNGKEVDEKSFSDMLFTSGCPDPDLIVRTGGEKRLSNFLLYQAAYAELYFTDTLWPDFDTEELYGILSDYSNRNRKFGKV